MRLVCIRAFGSFLPGDEIPADVLEDAGFNHTYFAVKPKPEPPVPTEPDEDTKEDE